jgi:hypothetical protein
MVGIVKLALRRPYSFIVMAVLIMVRLPATALMTVNRGTQVAVVGDGNRDGLAPSTPCRSSRRTPLWPQEAERNCPPTAALRCRLNRSTQHRR